MLKELRTDSKLSTDSQEAWPKAGPSHVPLHKWARRGERVLKLPSMDIVQGAGRSRSQRQGRELRVRRRAAQAGRNRLWQVHVDRA